MNRRRLFHTRDRGAVLPIVALLLPVLMIMTAFAVDLGRQRTSRRDMQAAADMVALDMARLADGRTVQQIGASLNSDDLTVQALSVGDRFELTATSNGLDTGGAKVEFGRWDGTTFHGPFGIFEAPNFQALVPSERPNAVRVITSESTDYYFQPGGGESVRTATAVHGIPSACVSIGSFAGEITAGDATVLNSLLGPLRLLSYEGVATADINVLGLIEAMPGAGTPAEVLRTPVSVAQVIEAAITLLPAGGPSEVEAQLLDLATTATTLSLGNITLGDLIGLDAGSEHAAAEATINVLDLLVGSVVLANGTNFVSVDDLGVTVPGLTVTSGATIIETLHLHCGPVGSMVSTEQVEIEAVVTVGFSPTELQDALDGVGPPLDAVVAPLLSIVDGIIDALLCNPLTSWLLCPPPPDELVKLTVAADVAGASSTIQSVVCTGDRTEVSMLSQAHLARAEVMLEIAGETLTTPLELSMAGAPEPPWSTDPDVPLPQSYSIGTQDLGLTDMDLSLFGIQSLEPILNGLFTPLDQHLLKPVLSTLGLDLVGGDLTVRSASCDGVMLVE